MVSRWINPDCSANIGANLTGPIDNCFAIAKHLAGAFNCYAQSSPNMTVMVDAGVVSVASSNTVSRIAAQQSATIVAPIGSNQRYDRLVFNASTGVVSVVTGTASNSPSAPNVPSGNLPLACIGPLTSATTQITDNLITDERARWPQSNTAMVESFGNLTSLTSFIGGFNVSNLTANMRRVSISFTELRADANAASFAAGQLLTFASANATGIYTGTSGATFCGGSVTMNATQIRVLGAGANSAGTTVPDIGLIFSNTVRLTGTITMTKETDGLYSIESEISNSNGTVWYMSSAWSFAPTANFGQNYPSTVTVFLGLSSAFNPINGNFSYTVENQ